MSRVPSLENLDAVLTSHVDRVGHVDEETVFDDAGYRRQRRRECSRVVDLAEVTVEDEVTVVGDDEAILALGLPERRFTTQVANALGNDALSVLKYRYGDRTVESVGEFRVFDDDEKSIGRRVDE